MLGIKIKIPHLFMGVAFSLHSYIHEGFVFFKTDVLQSSWLFSQEKKKKMVE